MSGAYSHVFAFDARNGRRLWHWAPEYAPELGTEDEMWMILAYLEAPRE